MARTCEFDKGCSNDVWGTDKKTNKGYCRFHQWCRTDTKKLVARASGKRVVMKKARKRKPVNAKLVEFFEQMMELNEPVCMNCGAGSNGEFAWLKEEQFKEKWKSCQAHILRKNKIKSVATNPLNILVLGSGFSGMCNCHDNFDSNYDKASGMFIWKEAARRFKKLYPLTTPEEHQYIPQQLLRTL
jgi:hypothetical protein